jgi:hypothetical protein
MTYMVQLAVPKCGIVVVDKEFGHRHPLFAGYAVCGAALPEIVDEVPHSCFIGGAAGHEAASGRTEAERSVPRGG